MFMVLSGGNLLGISFEEDSFIPPSVLNLNTIFLSILIEAIPFVLIGVLIAGMIQIFVTEDHIQKWMPKNRFLAVFMSCVLGGLFPACECGIVPIVRRLIAKGVPVYAGVGFLLTGPIINPIVILSTYMAFGNDGQMAGMRMLLGFTVALVVASIISLIFKGNQLKKTMQSGQVQSSSSIQHGTQPLSKRIEQMFKHSIDEFFDMGKYLILGAFFAAFVQTYVSSVWLMKLGEGVILSTLVMMALAFLLSLCSEADAFIAASFRNLFTPSALLGFLVYGPMLDLKNMIMMHAVFRARFVIVLCSLISIVVFASIMLIQLWV
ncbi:permease [Ammoniphilus sp. CFH 90114]|uniref:permease n=1 Tax=Ammoniphilus sp. CFH 90114 TaxID=2493665 RepID=UPI00100E7604|nr:permease [Ammoniphilus sp. CFH 90114]RXT14029.1 permease [Ammoniphilus sp. CFH 90114]